MTTEIGNSMNGSTIGRSESQIFDECNTFFTHERNKYMLALQASNKFKDLLKFSDLSNKFPTIILISICLGKRGLKMIDFLIRTLENGIDIFKLSGYQDFLKSNLRNKFLQAFQEDKSNCTQYLQRLEAKLSQGIYSAGIDTGTLKSVMSPQVGENLLDVVNEKNLVHLYGWLGKARSSLSYQSSHTLSLSCVYDHFCLNMHNELPLMVNGSPFNWKAFFERIDSMDDPTISQCLMDYSKKSDELGRNFVTKMIKGACCLMLRRYFANLLD